MYFWRRRRIVRSSCRAAPSGIGRSFLHSPTLPRRLRKMRKPESSGPGQRQLRVGELIRHAIAESLQRGDIHDPAFEGVIVTVPEVRMTPDLKTATVFVV